MKTAIGIDIGDTNFRISVLEGNTPRLIRDGTGCTCFPSKVSFLQGGGCLVGNDAQMFGIPENTVLHPMTIIGAPFLDLSQLNGRYAYRFCQGEEGVYIDAHRAYPAVPDVLVAIFAHAKKLAEDDLGRQVDEAVIAIPDGLSDPKRIAIAQCAAAAGLPAKQLLNQTTAAALGYRFDLGNPKTIAVIDVGASHTSVSMLKGGANRLEMKSTSHCATGANIFHQRVIELICHKAHREYGVRLSGEERDFLAQELSNEAGIALVELSSKEAVEASIGGALPNGGRAVVDLRREEFSHLIRDDLRRIESLLPNYQVDTVLLIGGGSNIPAVKQIVDRAFRKPPFISPSVVSAEAVALGAAIKGGMLDGIIGTESIERTVNDLGTFYNGDKMDVLIPKGTPFPCHVSKEYGMHPGPYTEKVYQWIGNGSGQNKVEGRDKDLIVLADKRIGLTGYQVRCTFIIDIHGVAQFVVTDTKSNEQYVLTGFAIK